MTDTKRGPWYRRRLGWLLTVVVMCPVFLTVIGFFDVHGPDWLTTATTTYLLGANLVVLWWYADTQVLLLESSDAQHEHTLRMSRIAHRPFVVVERVQNERGEFHYYIRNIGAGLAVNVWSIRVTEGDVPLKQSLGALGPNGSRVLSGSLEGELRNRNDVFQWALAAEGLVDLTEQWTVTANIRERMSGGEMLSRRLPVRSRDTARTLDELLNEEWGSIKEGLRATTFPP